MQHLTNTEEETQISREGVTLNTSIAAKFLEIGLERWPHLGKEGSYPGCQDPYFEFSGEIFE
jgi:hypothetical protein